MLQNITRNLVNLRASNLPLSIGILGMVQVRFDSGLGSAQVKRLEVVRRHEKVSEILSRVKHRDGFPKIPSHVEHLVGRVTTSTNSGVDDQKDMPGLDLAEKTQLILQSNHPVRHILEREIYNNTKQSVSYHDWLTLFGRGIRLNKSPKYEEMLNNIAKASDSGMFSSDIHQSVLDIPEDYKPVNIHTQYALGNKYAVLVGDYFAIRCIYFIEKTKNSKALMAITKGLEQFTTANFAVPLVDPKIIYPIVPNKQASLDEWVKYSKKSSGYFTGGLYAILVVNYDGLPKNEKVMSNVKKFCSNLAVLLKGVAEIESFENGDELSTLSPFVLTSLPAILYQQKHPGVFDSLRQQQINFKTDELKLVIEEIERSSSIHEAKFILGELSLETKRNLEGITTDLFYSEVIHDLVDATSSFD